jgi:hypothetical protein
MGNRESASAALLFFQADNRGRGKSAAGKQGTELTKEKKGP